MDANKKKVLFIGTTDYNLTKTDETIQKKWEGLAANIDAFVLARGQTLRARKYGAEFYLTPKILGKIGMPAWMLISFLRGLWIIMAERIDVIVAQSPALDGCVAACLKIITRRELIVEIHGDWIESPFFYFDIPCARVVRKILIALGKFSLLRADKIRVISGATEKLARKYYRGQRIYKYPTFTDIDIFKSETDLSFEPVIMYAGWLYRLKGVQFLIEAFGRLQDKYPDFKLLIVGDGPYRKELEALTEKSRIKRIEFAGRKPLFEVKDHMRHSTCFVLPSLSEGLGRVLIEAAMLKKPSIGTNVDGIPDIIQDGINGYLFEPGNVDELTAKLDSLMGNKELAVKMGEAGRKLVEDKFSTQKYFEDYVKMIND
ncbi:MAG: glycosyltransferase family 4 protein [Candidatus Falkowbacteria bacterium]